MSMEDKKDTSHKVCLWFKTPQGCRNGPKCKFLHEEDTKDLPLCKFYSSAYGCFRGNSCAFRHEGSGPTRSNIPPTSLSITDIRRESKKPTQPGIKSKALPIGDEEPSKIIEKESPTPLTKASRRIDTQPVRPPRSSDSDQGQVTRPVPVIDPKPQQDKLRQEQQPTKSAPLKEEKSKQQINKKDEEEEQDEDEQDEEEEEQEETSPVPVSAPNPTPNPPATKQPSQPVSRGITKNEESTRPAAKQDVEKKEKEKEKSREKDDKEAENQKDKWRGSTGAAQSGGKPATTSTQSTPTGSAWKKSGEQEQNKPQPTKPSAAPVTATKSKEPISPSKKPVPSSTTSSSSKPAVEKKVAPQSTKSAPQSATSPKSPTGPTTTKAAATSATSPKTGATNPQAAKTTAKGAWRQPLRPPGLKEKEGETTKR